VHVGGLARSDSGNFTSEFAGLLTRLGQAARPVREGYRSTLQITSDAEDAEDVIGAGKD
jgi:hypothetical protein